MGERRIPDRWVGCLALLPTAIVGAVFLYGFAAWTGWISLTASTILPSNIFVGLAQYDRLWNNPRWLTAYGNLFVFGVLYVALCVGIGLSLAILLDRGVRAGGLLRTLYLYPLAISFVVTGTAWRWIFDPSLGLQAAVRALGWTGFDFDWLNDPDRAIYTLVVAGVWQSSGFAMAVFLAALSGIDDEIVKAARIDGASPWRIYAFILVPMLRPAFLTVIVLLSVAVLRNFDLVVVLTGGGPGYSSDLPSRFMYEMAFRRDQLGLGAASAIILFVTFLAIILPYLGSELRARR
jgi:glucose/mannose transport system permease protein